MLLGKILRGKTFSSARHECGNSNETGLHPLASLGSDEALGAADEAAFDWLGAPVRCETCAHFQLTLTGLCHKGRSCVLDRRIKHIDRFFRSVPHLADSYLDHPYFELRAVAVKYAGLFRVAPMLRDPEPEVRAMCVSRLPPERVKALAKDPDRRVRIGVALKMEGKALLDMLSDPDHYVRVVIVRKLKPDVVPVAMHDPEPTVRRWVARRIVATRLIEMCRDPDPMVRMEVAARLDPAVLSIFSADPDLRVRFTAAERIAPDLLPAFLQDEDPVVRELAQMRSAEIAGTVVAPV